MTAYWKTIQDKVLFPLLVAACLSAISGIIMVIRMNDKVEALQSLTPLKQDVAVLQSRVDRIEKVDEVQWQALARKKDKP